LPSRAQPQVLIVDDVPANLLALEVLLQGLDCRVVVAASGDAALSLIARDQFALMLLDVHMPCMDGYEVARRARMSSQTRQLPIVFLTASREVDEKQLRMGYDSGAIDYLFKPLDRDVLKSKVSVFLDLFVSRRELEEANQRLEAINAKLLALAEAEATSAHALRQANDELGMAYRELRAAQAPLIQSARVPAVNVLPALDADRAFQPLSAVTEKLKTARAKLLRLRAKELVSVTSGGERDWQEVEALLRAASQELERARPSRRRRDQPTRRGA
jgi:CheY-like chemotaxis protein